MARDVLLVFAKVPEPGRVKTRLSPPLTAEQASTLYAAFLGDSLDRYASLSSAPGGPEVRLFVGGDPDDDRLSALVPDGMRVARQQGSGLGARMLRAFVEAFATGAERVVVIGTDHPTLPDAYITLAFDQLADPMTAVLGPSDDGGYYLLGLNDLAPDLFDMDYSHERVFEDTLRRTAGAGLSPVVLPPHYDVDDGDTLVRLIEEWRSGADIGTRTAAVLRTLTESSSGTD